jgi:hypothetical protein
MIGTHKGLEDLHAHRDFVLSALKRFEAVINFGIAPNARRQQA